ncbi:phytanoyl-CoA dioxygenase family protein [Pelagibius sp. Alg239-R121]|uniref:phytanoyl-CoA dioxygenase family protein n=1 Tax=Pelagibius sp. Alg239-R121 TaxID=2993448 RepID=UPI0024A65945|nr:phytanoyl-CoA dioxygenase family protein [Pelagibius sp. Alg239-R121]
MSARETFQDQGYFLAENLLDPGADLTPVMSDYARILETLLLELQKVGRVDEGWHRMDFDARVKFLYHEAGGLYAQNFDICVPPQAGLPSDIPICLSDAIFGLLTHNRLLDFVEDLIGPEIRVNPVQHVRIKPPENLLENASDDGDFHAALRVTNKNGLMAQTPWHQDNAVLTEDADETEMITVWFPLTPAPENMGCLTVVPGSHKEGLRTHCPGETTDLSVPASLVPVERAVSLPMERGDVLFLHRRMLHASLTNSSDRVRFSFDLRYQPDGKPTGRALLPSFLARSHTQPSEVVRDPEVWRSCWYAAIQALSQAPEVPASNRWSAEASLCA